MIVSVWAVLLAFVDDVLKLLGLVALGVFGAVALSYLLGVL